MFANFTKKENIVYGKLMDYCFDNDCNEVVLPIIAMELVTPLKQPKQLKKETKQPNLLRYE